ncbi:MAG: YggT family protein [Treponema sp.]|jgi:YggT family protein|nr:YggT family protein [Treponema sp.]
MTYIFRTLAALVNIYMLLCFIRILLTWIPGFAYSPFARFLSSLCDPFLRMFSGIRWLHIANIDFTPILALGVLTALASIFGNAASFGYFSFGGILAVIISVGWSLISSVFGFLLIFIVIRLLVLIFSRNNGNGSFIWNQIDYTLNPVVSRIAGFFSNGRPISYRNSLILAVIMLVLFQIAGKFLTSSLIYLCSRIPF